MSFYGLNRAAINAGVVSSVAGAALLAASSTVEAIPRLGILAQANSVALSFSEAYGHSIQPGFAESSAGLLASAQWALLIESDATIQVQSSMSALPYTNAEAADPPNRTMRRPFVDRVMRRQA